MVTESPVSLPTCILDSCLRWALLLLALFLGGGHARAATSDELRELVGRVETQYLGRTSHAIVEMEVQTRRRHRTLELELYGEGREKMLVVVRAPSKDRGVATLKVGDRIWNYVPRIDRVVRISGALLGERWLGSHLTNDDLVKESKIDEQYTFRALAAKGTTVVVEARPRPDAPVVWDRIVYTIDRERLVPVEVRYADETGTWIRRIRFTDVRRVAGRWVPFEMLVEPLDAPGEYTRLRYRRLEFDVPLPPRIFTVEALRRRRR